MAGLRRLDSAKYAGEGRRGVIQELLGLAEDEDRPWGISSQAPAIYAFLVNFVFNVMPIFFS